MIKIRNLTKSYRIKDQRHYVFRRINADFPEGANIGIIGPNGGGKSTFLRILGGIDYPDSGQILTQRSFSWPLGLRGGFIMHLSGRENCRIICNLYGLRNREVSVKLDEIKELSGIEDYFEEPLKYYSSGMSGRLGFALSMVFQFDYFLIDEITAVGDANFRQLAKETLEEKAQHSKVIMVSHNMSDIKKFCDVGVLLMDGCLTVFEDVDQAIEAYLPRTKVREDDASELNRIAGVGELELGNVAIPGLLRDASSEVSELLSSITERLEDGAAAIEGDSAGFLSLLGTACQQLGHFILAERYHRQAICENAYILSSLLALGQLALLQNNLASARSWAEQADKIDALNPRTQLLQIRLLVKEGRFGGAVELAEKCLLKHVENPLIWNEYAMALSGDKQMLQAINAQVKAIQHAEESSGADHQIGGFYQQLSQMLVASNAFDDAVVAAYKASLIPKADPLDRYQNPLKLLRRLDARISA